MDISFKQLAHKIVLFYLRRASHKKYLTFSFSDLIILCPPNVFPPNSFTTDLMAKWLVNEEMEGKQVLEMGCGSGYISIIAARKGAKVIASDISPIAVDAAKINTIINKIKNVECYCSDLFSNLEGKFDLILFNAPFFHGEPTSLLDNNWMSKDGEVVSKFFKDAREYINPMGKVVITSSTLVNQDALKILIKESGFNIENVKTKNIIIEKFFLYECRAF